MLANTDILVLLDLDRWIDRDIHIYFFLVVFRQNFITDNLLFYTVLFQEFLPRVFRMDLSSAKNAYMMFRVTKVFGLPNLAELIHNGKFLQSLSFTLTLPMLRLLSSNNNINKKID